MNLLLNLQKITLFLAVADSGSFTKSAEQFLLHQSSVSLHIADLERTLGVKLFERQGRIATLTDAGKLLYPHAQHLLAANRSATEAITAYKGVMTGTLRIGASTTPGEYLLPTWLSQFQNQYPNIAIELEIGNSKRILKHLLEGDLSFAIVGYLLDTHSFEVSIVSTDEIVLVVSKQHAWAKSKQISLDEVQNARWVCRESGSATRRITEQALGERCCTLYPALELGSTTAVKQAIMAGLGIGFLPRVAVTAEASAGSLVIVAIKDVHISRHIYLDLTRS